MARLKKASEQEDAKSNNSGVDGERNVLLMSLGCLSVCLVFCITVFGMVCCSLARKRDVVLNKDAAERIVKAHTTESTVRTSGKRRAEESSQEEGPKTDSEERTKRSKKTV